MVNSLPAPIQPAHTNVIYHYCEPSRWGVSRAYDFYIEKAINLFYEHYDDLPDDIRQHLILEIVKTRNTNINFSQFIDKSLRDEMECRADYEITLKRMIKEVSHV